VDFEVEQASLCAEHGSCFGLGDECQTVVVLVAEEASLDRSSSGRGFASIIPDSRHSQEVFDVALLTVEDLTQTLLQLIAHCLSELEEVVGSNVNLRLARWKRRKVDGIDVCVSAQHELQLKPFHLLHAWLGVAGRRQCFGNIGSPSYDLLVLVVV
jgi:hypothetical protein